jgi:hypothetical protein
LIKENQNTLKKAELNNKLRHAMYCLDCAEARRLVDRGADPNTLKRIDCSHAGGCVAMTHKNANGGNWHWIFSPSSLDGCFFIHSFLSSQFS